MDNKLCCVFIDNSNLFIEGQRAYAKQQQFLVDNDIRFRINFGQLMNVLVGDRKVAHAALYGSEPPPVDDVWKRIRETNIELFLYKRNDKNREKELQTDLTAHVTRKAMEMSQKYVGELTKLTFIIVAGDGDFISAFKQVFQEKFKLEVWAWKNSLAGRIKKFETEHKDDMSIFYLDDYIKEDNTDTPCIRFINCRWDPANQEFPDERSIVIQHSVAIDKAVMLTNEITKLIKMPCRYWQPDPWTVIVIVMSEEFRTTESIVEKCKDALSRMTPGTMRVTDYNSYMESCREEIPLLPRNDIPKCKVAMPCIYKFACFHGSGCNYQHSEEEQKHFEDHPNLIGKKYKSMFCINVKKFGKCRHESCVYAHNLSEARCYICDRGGLVGDHWMDECKNKIE